MQTTSKSVNVCSMQSVMQRGANLEVVLVKVLNLVGLDELVEASHEGLHLLLYSRHETPLDDQTAHVRVCKCTSMTNTRTMVEQYSTVRIQYSSAGRRARRKEKEEEKENGTRAVRECIDREPTRCTRACSRSWRWCCARWAWGRARRASRTPPRSPRSSARGRAGRCPGSTWATGSTRGSAAHGSIKTPLFNNSDEEFHEHQVWVHTLTSCSGNSWLLTDALSYQILLYPEV